MAEELLPRLRIDVCPFTEFYCWGYFYVLIPFPFISLFYLCSALTSLAIIFSFMCVFFWRYVSFPLSLTYLDVDLSLKYAHTHTHTHTPLSWSWLSPQNTVLWLQYHFFRKYTSSTSHSQIHIHSWRLLIMISITKSNHFLSYINASFNTEHILPIFKFSVFDFHSSISPKFYWAWTWGILL